MNLMNKMSLLMCLGAKSAHFKPETASEKSTVADIKVACVFEIALRNTKGN